MKNLLFYSLLLFVFSCSSENTVDRFDTHQIPSGVVLSNFKEDYNKPYGKWSLTFYMTNKTKEKIQLPQIDANLYVDDKFVGRVTGGVLTPLDANQTGQLSFSYILPNEAPSKIEFMYIK